MNRLEAEQEASDEAFDKFQSDLVQSETITAVYQRERPLYWDLTARIAAAEAGKIQCIADDAERIRKFVQVRTALLNAMRGVFESFDEVLNNRPPTAAVSRLDVALAKARSCFGRLQNDDKSYDDLRWSNGRNGNAIDIDGGVWSDDQRVPRVVGLEEGLRLRRVAKKTLDATRRTYRMLENQLLVDNAGPMLGERAAFVSISWKVCE